MTRKQFKTALMGAGYFVHNVRVRDGAEYGIFRAYATRERLFAIDYRPIRREVWLHECVNGFDYRPFKIMFINKNGDLASEPDAHSG